jgi:hypothetical protein
LQWVFLKSDHEWPVSKIATTKAPCRRSSRALSLFSVESVFTCSSSWHILAQGQLYGQKHGDLKQVSVCLKKNHITKSPLNMLVVYSTLLI